jgi:hypothetical protein
LASSGLTAVCAGCLETATREADKIIQTVLSRVLDDTAKGINPTDSLKALRKEAAQRKASRDPSQN